jgi:hypothetical protein
MLRRGKRDKKIRKCIKKLSQSNYKVYYYEMGIVKEYLTAEHLTRELKHKPDTNHEHLTRIEAQTRYQS